MAIEKLVPQYLNKDEDERLVKPFEMTDALNVRVSHETEGTQGIIKNVEGNTAVASASPADAVPTVGENRVVGATPCEAGKCMYFFLYNSEEDHGIYRYDSVNNTYNKLYEDSVLNFQRNSFIKGDVVINQHQEHLLYFTDGRNEPRKINATKLLLGTYGDNLYSGTDVQKQKFLTVCKQPPQDQITFTFQTNDNYQFNNLKENCFQFAYQYVYDDGEVSALSAYSNIAVSPTHMAYNAPSIEFLGALNNELLLTVSSSDGPVRKIRVFARKNNDQPFYKVEELDNITSAGQQTFTFRNDGVYTLLSDEETNKPFDSVPRRASSQAISGGRLMYGDYLEGFDNLEQTDVYAYPVYDQRANTASNATMQFVDGLTESMSYSNLPSGGVTELQDMQYAFMGGQVTSNPGINVPFARFGDATTNGINFKLDLSSFPAQGISASSGVVDFNVNLSASTIGIGVTGGSGSAGANTRMQVQAGVYYGNGTEQIHEANINILNNDNALDSINVKPVGGITFQASAPAPDASSPQEFFNWLEENIVGTQATVAVEPRALGTTDNVYLGCSMMGCKSTANATPSDAATGDQLYFWLTGILTYEIYSAVFGVDENEVVFKVRLVGTDLEAVRAIAPRQFNSSGGAINNDFVNTTNSPLYQQGVPGNQLSLTTHDAYIYEGNNIQFEINNSNVNSDNVFLKDWSIGNDGAYRSYFFDYEVSGGELSIVSSDGQDSTSFKAGASHELGVVYYDHRNRASGVQPVSEVSVSHFGASERRGREGRTSLDMRLLHAPPEWATKWSAVYSKNTTYEKVIQVAVAEAGLGKATAFVDIRSNDGEKKRPILQGLEGGVNGQIFLSMRPLEGKSNSYRDFKGAEIEYKYQEGDVLRVIEYIDQNGATRRPMAELKITSYKYYLDDDDNPIKLSDASEEDDETDYRRSGWFLTVRDNSISGFSRADVAAGKDFFSQRCLVEIYRPKKNSEDRLYYEIGGQRDIVEVGGLRTHAGDRSNVSQADFSISVLAPLRFTSSTRLYRGDRVNVASLNNSGYVFVEDVLINSGGSYEYIVHPSNQFNTLNVSITNASVLTTAGSPNSLFPGVVTLDEGDVYMRIREQLSNPEIDYNPLNDASVTRLFNPTLPDDQVYAKYIIESERVSDFFDSNAVSIGRPHIETPDQKEIVRTSAVTYSEPYTSDSSRLNLSSFNPSLFPYKDYNSSNGFITYLVDKGESLLVLQEKKVSATPVGRQLIESSSDGMLVTSKNVLGTETYFAGTYGPGRNPESVLDRFGITYFCDMEAGKVVRVSSKGIEPISDIKMESFFEGLFADLMVREQIPRIPCGIDPENSELVVTTEGQSVNDITFGDTPIGDIPTPGSSPAVANADGILKPVSTLENLLTWDREVLTWEADIIRPVEYLPVWSRVGCGVIYADRLTERASVFIEPRRFETSAATYMDVLTSDDSYRGIALMSNLDGSVKFNTTIATSPGVGGTVVGEAVTIADGVDDDGMTACFSLTNNFWMSFYSFNPELYSMLHNRFFSFENGVMYRHNVNQTRNNFYGTQYTSMVELVSKQVPSSVKTYNALSLEGNDTWAGLISNTEQQADVTEDMYEEREGMYYTVMPKDSTPNSTNNTSYRVVLGVIESVSGSGDTLAKFDGRISNLPFGIGDIAAVLTADGETVISRTVLSIVDRKTIQFNNDMSAYVGDTILVFSTDEINGDKIRDYFARIKLTNDSVSGVELYAVNAVYSPSPLHNDQQK